MVRPELGKIHSHEVERCEARHSQASPMQWRSSGEITSRNTKTRKMTAKVKCNLPVPPLPATKPYHSKPEMPAGLDSPRLKWRVTPKKRKPPRQYREPLTPKDQTTKRKRYGKWSPEEREDIARRHDAGETWDQIAESYGTTYASVRAAVYRRKHKG